MRQRFQIFRGEVTITVEIFDGALRMVMSPNEGELLKLELEPRDARALASVLEHFAKVKEEDG